MALLQSFYGQSTSKTPARPRFVSGRQIEETGGRARGRRPYTVGERLTDKTIELLQQSDDELDQEESQHLHDRMYSFSPRQLQKSAHYTNSSQFPHPPQGLPQSPDILSLLQQQQVLLSQVLSEQKEIKDTQKSLCKRVCTMETEISLLGHSAASSSSSSSPTSVSIKKRRITRDLTNKISKVHDNLQDQLKPQESSTSVHNKRIKLAIVQKISQATDFNEGEISAAIKRKYESMRRQWLAEGKENSEDLNKIEAVKKKNRQRRQRKFDSRKCVVKKEETKYWNQLSLNYMTEESDDLSDSNAIVEHKLTWRSNDLEEFIGQLDARYQKKVSREGGTVAKKIRKQGRPSTSQPPVDAPAWTVKDTAERATVSESVDSDLSFSQ